MSLLPAVSLHVLLFGLLLCLDRDFILSMRVNLHPDTEPTGHEVHNNNRMLFHDENLYHLEYAGLLNDSLVGSHFLEDKRDADGKFSRGNFSFSAFEKVRKSNTIRWFSDLEEMVARHVYDDPRDRDLSAGPQVNQELCGLHLDYMLQLNERHNKRFVSSSELSMFKIMNTYESPHLGLATGSNIFFGEYRECIASKLNVVRKELEKLNKTASDMYFDKVVNERTPILEHPIVETIFHYMGPFFGYPYKEKVSLKPVKDKMHLLPMRYCFLALRWPSWPNSSFHSRSLTLLTASCLPETCDSNSLTPHGAKIKRLYDTQLSDYFSGYYIERIYCLPDENSEFRNPFNYNLTVAFIGFNAVWLSLTVIAVLIRPSNGDRPATICACNGASWRNRIWLYLSPWCLTKNFLCFLALKRDSQAGEEKKRPVPTRPKNHEVDLLPLEGLKVVASLSVMISHGSMFYFPNSWNNERTHNMLSESWVESGFITYPAVVNIFFVVSSVMTARILLEMPNKVLFKPLFWLKFIAYRYSRIVPLYLIFHWFLKSTFRFLGSGPLWDYGTSHTALAKICQNETWWNVILPSANFISPAVHCNGVGWYLANDMQFSILTPILIVLFKKRPRVGLIGTFLALLAAIGAHMTFFFRLNTDWRSTFEYDITSLSLVLDVAPLGYVLPQYRCVAPLIGLIAGYLLDKYARGEIAAWPDKFVRYGKMYIYFVIYICLFLPAITSLLPLNNSSLMRILFAIYGGLLHSIASLAAAFLILLLCTGYFPNCQKIFSLDLFRLLAKASLSTVLTHLPLMFYRSQSATRFREAKVGGFYVTMACWLIESFVISVFIHVLYEIPARAILVKLLTRSPAAASSSNQKTRDKEKMK